MTKLSNVLGNAGWKLVESLGEGGQARLHLVTKLSEPDGQSYACKELKNTQSMQAVQRFIREVDATKSIDHPGVVRIVDRSREGSERHFYVMEYVQDAVPLLSLLNSDTNPFYRNAARSLAFFISIIEALKACEHKDVVHRDLSPGNILVMPDNSAKIIDFGCCHLDLAEPVTLTDENVGTPNYRAPECEAFSESKVTTQADLYSAGKILWSTVVDRRAFPRENVWQSEALSLRHIFPEQPDLWHLTALFEKSVRHDPKNRWKDTGEALSDAWNVHRLITSRFLPVEAIGQGWCPVCGDRTLRDMGSGDATLSPTAMHNLLHDLPKKNVQICVKCGYIMLVNQEIRSKHTSRLNGLV